MKTALIWMRAFFLLVVWVTFGCSSSDSGSSATGGAGGSHAGSSNGGSSNGGSSNGGSAGSVVAGSAGTGTGGTAGSGTAGSAGMGGASGGSAGAAGAGGGAPFVYFVKQANGTTTATLAGGTISVSSSFGTSGNAFKYVMPNYYGTTSNG